MKMAVIMAVFHMSTGIICKGLNAIFFRKWLVFFFEVVAGLMIFWGLIGWLVFLVFFKWMFYPVDPYCNEKTDYECFAKVNMSPSLINTMTSLTVGFGSPPQSVDPATREEVDVQMFDSQTTIGVVMVLGVVVAVPLMLCVIPCVACCTHKKDAAHDGGHQNRDAGDDSESNQLIGNDDQQKDEAKADIRAYEELLNDEGGDESHGLDEIFIH